MDGVFTTTTLKAYEWLDTPMWVFDLGRRRMVWANAAGVTFWDAASLDELRSRSFADLSEATVTRNLAVMAEHRAGRTVHEQWTLYPKGKPTTVQIKSAAVTLDDGTQAILYEARALADAVDPAVLRGIEALQHTSVRVALHRLDGAALLRNPAAVRALGSVVADRHADDFGAMFVEAAAAQRARNAIADGATFSEEVQLATGDGPRWHGLDARPVLDPVTGETLVQVNARDITDRRTAELALERAKQYAEAASVAKSQFLANLSHEIRSPMNGVLGMLELVSGTQLDAEQQRYLDMAKLSAGTLLAVIDEILDFSKIEAGQVEIERVEMSLDHVVDLVVAPMEVRGRQKGVRVRGIVDPAIPARIVGDPHRVQQVLTNLVGNALKFTERGFVRVSADLTESTPAHAEVLFSVRDSGVGIARENQQRIFERFIQADGSTTRRYGGTGLGLTICHRMVRLMGGELWVESEVGKGSCFQFRLRFPRVAESEAAASPAPAQPDVPAATRNALGRQRTVLLAEDNAVNQEVAVSMLRHLGFQVVVAENGKQALAAAEAAQDLALVLMDVQMPVMGGFEATQLLRARQAATGRHVPILAMTAHAMEGDRARCLAAGMDDHVAKPIRLAVLAEVLQRWVP